MYLLLLAIVAAASAVLASAAWPHRRHAGLAHFALMESATAWWLLCYLGEQLDGPRALWWFSAKFPAIGVIPPSWLLFVLHHVGRPPRSRWWRLLYVWPVLLGPILVTNDLHRAFFTEIVFRRELIGLNAPLFVLHLAISYGCTLVALILLLRDWAQTRRTLSAVLAAGALLPWGANVLNEISKSSPHVAAWLPVNPTLPGFGLSALLIGYAVLRYGLFDPRPVARDLLFESLPELVVVLNDAGVIVDANRAAIETLAGDQPLIGRAWSAAVGRVEGWSALLDAPAQRLELPWHADGVARWFEIEQRPLRDKRQRSVGALLVLRDITARKRLEDDLRRESYSDGLTGLSNRRYFEDESQRLKASREFPVAVLAFDLDDLKVVNDTLGHEAGDKLLRAMAAFLRHFFRAGDRVFRIGGDEFSVLLPATDGTETEAICTRLDAHLQTFNASADVPLRFSTGWAVIERGEDWDDEVRRADDRLYQDKRRRGTRSTILRTPVTPGDGPPSISQDRVHP